MSFYSLRAKNAQSQPQQSGGGMAEKHGTEKQPPLHLCIFFKFSFFSHTFQSVTFLYYLLFILYFFSHKKKCEM